MAYFALSDTLVALRWVGTLGLLLTVTSRALSYDSPQVIPKPLLALLLARGAILPVCFLQCKVSGSSL